VWCHKQGAGLPKATLCLHHVCSTLQQLMMMSAAHQQKCGTKFDMISSTAGLLRRSFCTERATLPLYIVVIG
jgi:hypothetical protein